MAKDRSIKNTDKMFYILKDFFKNIREYFIECQTMLIQNAKMKKHYAMKMDLKWNGKLKAHHE